MLQVGMLVDNRYKILRVLGRGGSSCVFLAENIRIHNYWAIKEVYKTGRTSPGNPSNALLAESSILTKLRHPGLPTIVDVIETPQAYLIVMEYIEGVSLDKLLQQKGAQPEQVVLQWAKQLCDVLQYLHARTPAIIYRDMKPANIMLKPNGSVTLIDFGVAREYKPNHARDTVISERTAMLLRSSITAAVKLMRERTYTALVLRCIIWSPAWIPAEWAAYRLRGR